MVLGPRLTMSCEIGISNGACVKDLVRRGHCDGNSWDIRGGSNFPGDDPNPFGVQLAGCPHRSGVGWSAVFMTRSGSQGTGFTSVFGPNG